MVTSCYIPADPAVLLLTLAVQCHLQVRMASCVPWSTDQTWSQLKHAARCYWTNWV